MLAFDSRVFGHSNGNPRVAKPTLGSGERFEDDQSESSVPNCSERDSFPRPGVEPYGTLAPIVY